MGEETDETVLGEETDETVLCCMQFNYTVYLINFLLLSQGINHC